MKHNILMGISVLPALLIMPAFSDTITTRQVITDDTTYNDLTATNIASSTANNGGVFYMENTPTTTLTFNGTSTFSGNSLNNGGMGGVIGNGWLSSTSGTGYTPGGKIIFNGDASFSSNTTNNPNGGGAIFNYGNGTTANPDIRFNGDTNFSGNSTTGTSNNSVFSGGGAINHNNGTIIFDESANFSSNTSIYRGGAILSGGDIVFDDNATFDRNTATTSGGAIAILGGNVSFADSAVFTGNTAAAGAAIFLDNTNSQLTFADTATFSSNTGTGILLNNNSTGTVSFANGVTFDSNTNPLNGSLVNVGTITGTGGDFIFTNNTGSNGGGLKNSGTVSIDTTGQILFNTNTTTSTAGALDNGGAITLKGATTTFTGNKSNAGYGGAIFNAGDLEILGATNTFSGNIASDTGSTKSGGGAIHNRGNSGTTALTIGTESSTNTFSSNISHAHGGAIVSRAFDGVAQDSTVTINGATTFRGNHAALNGGAIWNATSNDGGISQITFNGTTNFINNSAQGAGGALYNNDTVTFNGNANFSGNTANGIANDIYNDGTVTFNGNTTITGGISGTGTINVASGKTLNIGTATLTQGSMNLDGTLLATLRAGNIPQINIIDTDGFSGTGTVKLSFDSAGTYSVFGNEIFDNTDISSSIYDLTWDGGDVTATIKSVSDIASANNISETAARTISNVSQSSSPLLNDLAVLMQDGLAYDTQTARDSVEKATRTINPESVPVNHSVNVSIQNALQLLASSRMSNFVIGRSGGDTNIGIGGIWAQGIYNKTKLNDSFNGYTRGISVGFDGTVNNIWTLGMGYMYGHSNIGTTSRNTQVDSHSVFVYTQYQPSNWYINAIANYSMSDYSEQGNALGIGVYSDYDLDTFGASATMGYDFIGGISPELSVQYMHLGSTDYTNSLGISNKIDSADYMTASIGTRYGFDMVMNNGWVLRPGIRYALKYDLISEDGRITVIMPGINSYTLDGDYLSRVSNEIGLELGMMYNSFKMSLNYDIESRADYTSQTGRVKFKYNF